MSFKFFQRFVGRGQAGPADGVGSSHNVARIPEGLRVYAVGDIHGRLDLLETMAGLISQDLLDRPLPCSTGSTDHALHHALSGTGEAIEVDEVGTDADVMDRSWHRPETGGEARLSRSVVTVFLGDYIDRGPSSKGVLDRLSGGVWPTPFIALMGNHELMCLQFLQDAETLSMWRDVGGLSTIASYGVDVSPLMAANMTPDAAEQIRIALRQAMPQDHVDFMMSSLQPCSSVGDYFFCHAGVRPGVLLRDQDPRDLMTIRDTFLGSDADFGKVVVHGHTPQEQPVFRRNRIGIDTGAYATGCLTCLVLEAAQVRTFDTR